MRTILATVVLVGTAAALSGCGSAMTKVRAPFKGDVLLCAQGHPSSTEMKTVRAIVDDRAKTLAGVHGPQVLLVRSRPHCVDVSVPGAQDKARALAFLTEKGDFVIGGTDVTSYNHTVAPGQIVRLVANGVPNASTNPQTVLMVVSDRDIVRGSASITFDTTGLPLVNYNMNKAGSKVWCQYTSSHINHFAPNVLDSRVLVDPMIVSAICGGNMETTGLDLGQAKKLEALLNYGVLPDALHRIA